MAAKYARFCFKCQFPRWAGVIFTPTFPLPPTLGTGGNTLAWRKNWPRISAARNFIVFSSLQGIIFKHWNWLLETINIQYLFLLPSNLLIGCCTCKMMLISGSVSIKILVNRILPYREGGGGMGWRELRLVSTTTMYRFLQLLNIYLFTISYEFLIKRIQFHIIFKY